MPGAAFFDLDRTLISRSSSLSLAPAFHRRGLLRRRDRTKARLAQLVFVRYGAGTSRVGQTAESAMAFLKGLPVDVMREIVQEAMASAFRPHVYRDALDSRRASSRARRAFVHRLCGAAGDRRRPRRRARARRRPRVVGRGRGRRVHRPPRSTAGRQGEGRGDRGARGGGGHRPRRVDRVLRLGERRAVPGGRRASGRGEPRPEAARDRGRAQLAGAPLQ